MPVRDRRVTPTALSRQGSTGFSGDPSWVSDGVGSFGLTERPTLEKSGSSFPWFLFPSRSLLRPNTVMKRSYYTVTFVRDDLLLSAG